MTEEDLKEFLDENRESIQRAVKEKMIEGLLAQNRWEISGQIAAVVQEFVKDEIVPEVKKYLADQKGPILAAAIAGAAAVGETLSKAIVERTAKRLAPDNYEFRQIMEAIFK
jgi:hypothetical protein